MTRRAVNAVLAAALLVAVGLLTAQLRAAATPARPVQTLPVLSGPVRIMELGDSTVAGTGSGCGDGDRYALGSWLQGVAGISATFVGSQVSGCHPWPRNEGHGCQTLEQLAGQVQGWLQANPADVVIVRGGVNDAIGSKLNGTTCTQGNPLESGQQMLAAADQLVQTILNVQPQMRVLVCQIPPPNGSANPGLLARGSQSVFEFNAGLPAALSRFGDQVRTVNTGILSTSSLADGLHPSDTGYVQIAWLELHYGLAPWLSTRPMPQTDMPFPTVPAAS